MKEAPPQGNQLDESQRIISMISGLPYRTAIDCLSQSHAMIRGSLREKIEKLKIELEEANGRLDEFSKFEASLNNALATPISESRYR